MRKKLLSRLKLFTKVTIIPLLYISLSSSIITLNTSTVEFIISPKNAQSGSFQKVEIVINPGSRVIKKGGGIRFEIPIAYLETAPVYWDVPQFKEAEARGYVEANTSNGANLAIKIYGHKNRIVECCIEDSSLLADDIIYFRYSGVIQNISGQCIIRAQWRESPDDEWEDAKPNMEIMILPHDAETILIVTPTEVAQNGNFDMSVTLLDKFGNLATGYTGTIEFKCTDSLADIPPSFSFSPQDSGLHIFRNLRFGSTGFQKIDATDGNLKGKYNYTYVSKSQSKYKRYFGDTHFHTGTGMDNKGFTNVGASGDHRGHLTTETDAYKYARDVMRLDFASAAEHDVKEFDQRLSNKIQKICNSFYEPGIFTTFFAYEWTAAPNVGHHVIVLKNPVEKILNHFDYPTKHDLFNAIELQNISALVIPHPMWTQSGHEIWNQVNYKYEKIGEIYSLWCSRFLIQPGDDTQRFELGSEDAWSFQYAWKHGHKIGVIGSSDNHTGRPGQNNFTNEIVHAGGLAVVLAEENNRDGIWEAFQNRRTYATTGTRIYLDFICEGHCMGEEFQLNSPPTFSVRVAGTNKLELVELVKYDKTQDYRVIKKVTPDNDICDFQFSDSTFSENSIYYVRVKQVDEIWRGAWAYPTAEMAWSSPIWINFVK